MGYKDYFTSNVKWTKVPFKDNPEDSEEGDGVDGNSDTSTLLGEKEKPKPQSMFRRAATAANPLLWILHVALLASNIIWLLSWNSWMHPPDDHSMLAARTDRD